MNTKGIVTCLAACIALGGSLGAWAQDPVPTPTHAAAEVEELSPEELGAKRESLLSITASIDTLSKDLKEKQRLLKTADAQTQTELNLDVQKLSEELHALQDNLVEIAAGIDLSAFKGRRERREISWNRELTELIGPLLNELKELTSRPREIDRLRTQSSEFKEQAKLARKAVTNLQQLDAGLKDPALDRPLSGMLNDWKDRAQYAETQLQITEQRLEQKINERKPISESISSITEIFFKSRGRNLAVAALFTCLFWLGLRRLQPTVEKYSPLHNRREKHILTRLFNLGYLMASTLGAVLVFLAILYLFEDWLLLILSAMLLFGVLWASKHTIPKFWGQSALLLNIGPVREGERIVLHGLPWRVGSIGFYTLLENPLLEGGVIRLHLNDLGELRSRQFDPGEPWFPTRKGDWVLLADGTFGCVERQTPELVELLLKGQSRKIIPSAEFTGAAPLVLSTGFRIATSFGVDYTHQREITTKLLDQLKSDIRRGLERAGYTSPQQASVEVEFESAASSSLNIAVLIDFAGSAAGDYQVLKRMVNRLCVEACNARGWTIPFDQLTIHLPKPLLKTRADQEREAAVV